MSVRLILVDASREARSGLAQRLKRSKDVELLGAVGNAREARDLGKSADLILLDLHGQNGQDRELCRSLSQSVSAPLVVLASFMTPDHWRQLQAAGASKYLLRHVNTKSLVRDLTALALELGWEHLTHPHVKYEWDQA